ncbi:hypothetical protein OIU76_003246 [Salix suchowensis]|uniref:Uncharacterized protein n=1 Tax=Salix koriyanagi TaxID=2511006 RepID=A0A9Q0P7N6_9ROSI|nr:hypothetical protein OIU76_003246 [Salix suchowensis]KAJ6683136.1 hypothetical protein OIU74_021234 [Salix koriyanagi]
MVFDIKTLAVVMNPTSSWPSRTKTISTRRKISNANILKQVRISRNDGQ